MSRETNDKDNENNDTFDERIAELVLLHSMYPGQVELDDARLQAAIVAEDVMVEVSHSPDTIDIVSGIFTVDSRTSLLEICFKLSKRPNETAIRCRVLDGNLSNSLQREMNEQISEFLQSKYDDAPVLIDAIQMIIGIWSDKDLKQYANSNRKTAKKLTIDDVDDDDSDDLFRYWIYSHHIKSKVKRKLILELCAKLSLTGFMLIGKPGFICVEGVRRDCENWWNEIRPLTWQRIALIDVESIGSDRSQLAFAQFDEHADRSAIFRQLKHKNCDKIIMNFLGISSSSSSSSASQKNEIT